jgi:hypothetical protein
MVKWTVIALILMGGWGCSSFKYYDRWERCDDLLKRSQQLNIDAVMFMDSLDTVIYKKNITIDSLLNELDKCQRSRIGRSRTKSF